MICEAGYTPEDFRRMTLRDAVAIFRGYSRRQYKDYRVAAWAIYQMAQMWIKEPGLFRPDKIMPDYDDIGLTPEERRRKDTDRQKRLMK